MEKSFFVNLCEKNFVWLCGKKIIWIASGYRLCKFCKSSVILWIIFYRIYPLARIYNPCDYETRKPENSKLKTQNFTSKYWIASFLAMTYNNQQFNNQQQISKSTNKQISKKKTCNSWTKKPHSNALKGQNQ